MITIYELNNSIDVLTPIGYAKALFIIDYGLEINSIWKCRIYETGKIVNVYDDEILVYPNPMNNEPPLKQEDIDDLLKRQTRWKKL